MAYMDIPRAVAEMLPIKALLISYHIWCNMLSKKVFGCITKFSPSVFVLVYSFEERAMSRVNRKVTPASSCNSNLMLDLAVIKMTSGQVDFSFII